ncbi:MAG: hypothetical protein JNL42_01625 [Anaerolineae bacterium]|nr:hypothetical protein [Anaerolineae bacterium]
MADDLISALRSLANKWALKARDYARESKVEGADAETAAYNRGFAEGFYRAATELAEAIKAQPAPVERPPVRAQPEGQPKPTEPNRNAGGRWNATPPTSSAPPAASTGASPSRQGGDQPPPAPRAAAVPPGTFEEIELSEVLIMLQYAGTVPRDLQPLPGNGFRAIFSRWENLTPPERQAKVVKMDFRVVILESGFTKDTRDPYIDFAFKRQRG